MKVFLKIVGLIILKLILMYDSNYYILNIDFNGHKKIKIKKRFLVWKENSCRFDSFIFLCHY